MTSESNPIEAGSTDAESTPAQPTQGLRYATLALWLIWAWIVMTVCHELGHVLAGLLTGANLQELEIRPWHLPHSIIIAGDNPLLTLWAGPILGSLLPILVAAIVRRPAVTFVAWFCLLANGSYLLLGYFSGDDQLDSIRLLGAGARPAEVLGPSLVAMLIGYLCFRRACIELLAGQTAIGSWRSLRLSTAALAALIVLQAIVGTILR